MAQKIADMTLDELRALIREVVEQVLFDFTQDPDAGLELNEDFAAKLEASIRAVESGKPIISAEELARKHGMSE